jgi:hypothetical protein
MMKVLAVLESRSDDCLPALLDYALNQIEAGTEIILVSTRPVDLNDSVHFQALSSDAHRRRLASQISSIDTSSDNLKQYFEVEM